MTTQSYTETTDIRNLSHTDAESLAWQFLLAAREIGAQPDNQSRYLGYDSHEGLLVRSNKTEHSTCLWLDDKGDWRCKENLPSVCQTLFDLYLPVLGNCHKSSCITAHLGQSIDARIATSSGDSFYVTGEENRKHLHYLRALCDAVIVGSGTVVADDPQLTTRAVPGPNPVRVIIDPGARLTAPLQIFDDGQANTLLVHRSSANLAQREMSFGPDIVDAAGRSCHQVERLVVPDSDNELSVDNVIALLNQRGLKRLFVEGGGLTVSRFFEERALDRLHVAVAPLLVGEGTTALQITGVTKMMQAHRPPHAIYRMGDDVLWDFDVSAMKKTARESVEAGEADEAESVSEDQQQPARASLERLV